MKNIKRVHLLAILLVFLGGVNWGLIGLLDINIVEVLFGNYYLVEKFIYLLFGISTIYIMANHIDYCKICSKIKLR